MPASAPELGVAFGVSGAWLAGLILAVPTALSLLVEPWLHLAADRAADRRWFVRAGYLAVAVAGVVAALTPSPWVLVVTFALCGPAWGAGSGTAEASLVALDPERAERQMTRWTIAGAIGDVAGPGLIALAVLCGHDWRAAFLVVSALALALAFATPPLPRRWISDDEPTAPLREALRNRRLVGWALGVGLCTFLDEILLVLAALHLARTHAADPTARALVLGTLLAASAAGLFLVERLLSRVAPTRLLAALCAVCAASYLGWMFAPSLPASVALAAVLGLTVAPQYPLAKAQAYRAAPDQPGAVNALCTVFEVLEVVVPLGVALVADRVGLTAALLLLLVQPLGLFLLAWHTTRRPGPEA